MILVASSLLSISSADIVNMSVTVIDEKGRPLNYAKVSVISPRPAAELLWTGQTDAEGKFSLNNIEEGTSIIIYVSWKGLIVAEFSTVAKDGNLTVVALVRDVNVVVLDSRDRPVPNCEVSLTCITPSKNETTMQLTGNDGIATFSQIPESVQLTSKLEITVRRFGSLVNKRLISSPYEECNITITCELYDLKVRVLDRLRNPVAGALVEASIGPKKVFFAHTDEEGLVDIFQLPPDFYELKATYGVQEWRAQVRIENDSSLDVILPFAKSYNVTLLFKWDDGRPGSGLRVLLRSGFSDLEVTTDASGASSLSLYPGVYNVTVSKGSSRLWDFSIEVRADTKKEFILNSSLRLNELTVRLRSSEGRVIDGTVVVSREGVEVGQASTSGGSAKLLLSDGLYRVVAQAQGYDVSEAEISLNSDQELELRLSPTPSPLSSPIVSIAIVACVALVTFAVARSLFSKRRE